MDKEKQNIGLQLIMMSTEHVNGIIMGEITNQNLSFKHKIGCSNCINKQRIPHHK